MKRDMKTYIKPELEQYGLLRVALCAASDSADIAVDGDEEADKDYDGGGDSKRRFGMVRFYDNYR